MLKQEKSWVLYDWANSAYPLLITTAVFPLYFKAAAAEAAIPGSTSTAYWGYANLCQAINGPSFCSFMY